jgi:hypothetical protein
VSTDTVYDIADGIHGKNGERLSSKGYESELFELKSDDIVVCIHTFDSFFFLKKLPQEFCIDIVGEDTKTIIRHKVAAR